MGRNYNSKICTYTYTLKIGTAKKKKNHEEKCVHSGPQRTSVCSHSHPPALYARMCVSICVFVCACVYACLSLWVSNRRLLSTQAFLTRVAFAAGNLEGGGNASHWDGEQTCLLCCKGWGIPCFSQTALLIPVGSAEGEEVTQHWCSSCYEWHSPLDRAQGNLLPSAKNAQFISLRRVKEIILQANSMLHTIEEALIRRHGKGREQGKTSMV